MVEIRYSIVFRPQKFILREYLNQGNLDLDDFFPKMCSKFIGKVTKIKGVRRRRRPEVPPLMLWFQSTLSLIMQIIKNKNKTGGH